MTDPRRAAPTQVQHPWRATARTALAIAVALGIVLPLAWAIVQDELGGIIAAEVMTVLGQVVAAIVAVSAAITRIMAIPIVSDLLTRLGIGPAPRSEQPAGEQLP